MPFIKKEMSQNEYHIWQLVAMGKQTSIADKEGERRKKVYEFRCYKRRTILHLAAMFVFILFCRFTYSLVDVVVRGDLDS